MFLHCHLVLEPTYYAHSNCEKDYLREMRPKLDSGLNCTTLRSNLTKFAHPRMIVFKRSILSFLIWSQEKSLIISKPGRRWFHHVDVYRFAQRLVFIGGIERCSRLLGRIVRIGRPPKHVEVRTACRGQISTTKEDHHVSVVLIFDDQAAKWRMS
jgi:hypothetical protein